MSEEIIICGARRGRWSKPIPYNDFPLTFYNEDTGRKMKPPKKVECDDGRHEGRKKWFPLQEMYVQKYKLTKKELRQAIDEMDVFSLEVAPLIICVECAKKGKK